jgi:mono/diheme cytochrome c family protein
MKPIYLMATVFVLAACNESPSPAKPGTAGPGTEPAAAPHGLDARLVARGGQLYQTYCAVCHGANAEGAPNWHQKGPDGKLPPPPLDAGGHAWHHPKVALIRTIKDGTLKLGGGMPPWKDTLSDDDIEAVIAWFQSRWPAEVYRSWTQMDEKARTK